MTHRTSCQRTHDPAGFTLIEVLMATVIVGIAMVSVTWGMSSATTSKAILSEDTFDVALVAKEIHELAELLPRAPSGATGATTGSGVLALDSLIDARFSPPIRADRTTLTALTGWTQDVDLLIYDLADLTTPTVSDPASGLSKTDSQLYQLRVSISRQGQSEGTFHWWITP